MIPQRQIKGAQGEALAAAYLKKIGMAIVGQNWRCPLGEIDLIAQDRNGRLVIVEVKSAQGDISWARESITLKKQQKLKWLALAYLKTKNLGLETALRFDAVIVNLATGEIEHWPDAFWVKEEI